MSPSLDRPERHVFFAQLADMAMAAGNHAVAAALRSEAICLAVLQAEELWRAGGGDPTTLGALPREEMDTQPVRVLEGEDMCAGCGRARSTW